MKICHDWIRVCTAANIPLYKTDNPVLRKFLEDNVANGGSIPKCSQLRDRYLFDVYEAERTELKSLVRGKKVALIADELSDEEGRYVLNVMAVLLDFDELSPNGNSVAYLLDSHFLSSTNNKTVAQKVVQTANDYGIDYDSVLVFNSDNVAYMKKAFSEALSCIFSNCVHVTCLSHIINLVASDFKKKFKDVTEFVKCFRNLFFVSGGRKSRFRNFLQDAIGTTSTVKMPPNPTTKSWKAWFDSALYHADHYFLFGDFINNELILSGNSACNSLIRLGEIYNDCSFMKRLHAQLAFIKNKAPTLLMYLDYFQERTPHIIAAHGKLESLLWYLSANSQLQEEDIDFCFTGDFSFEEKEELVNLGNTAFTTAYVKLDKYVNGGAQPAAKFLDQIRVLDPNNLIDTGLTYDNIDSIPGFENVTRDEWKLYANAIGPTAVKKSKDGMDLILFWKSKAAELPELYKIASTYCTATITSCDVERSFSSYNEILDEKRRSLDPTTMKVFHFLNWNIRVKSSLEKEQEEQHSKKTASKPPSVFITTSPTSSPKATSQQGNVFTKTESKLKSFSNTTSTRNTASSSKETLSKTANVFTKLVSKPLGVSYTISSKPESNSMPSFSKPANESKSPRFSSTTSSPKPTSSTKESFSKQGNFFNKTVSKLPTASNAMSQKPSSSSEATSQPGNVFKTNSPKPPSVSITAESSEPSDISTTAPTDSSSTFTAILSEPPGASKTASTESANIIVTNKRKAESSDVSYKRKKQVEKRVSFRIHYGLQNLAPTLNTEASCDFPECNRPLRSCLLNGTVKFQGDSVIDGGDIIGLLGGNSADEENYLGNFVVDSYLKLISMESSMKGLSTVSLKWERFEKNVGKECARDVLKRKDGKASFLEHDLILTPCNEPGSKHWFLLVTKPKEKQMLVLDSLAGSFIKPSTARAMDKMWSVVKELDEDVNEWEWSFHTNTPRDIPQQQNGFDCGVFVCAYARNLALQSPVPCQTSVPSFRSVMLLELHNKAMYDFTEASPQVGLYYAVEYGKSYYIGRALGSPSGDSCRTTFKFLHSTGARSFDWPRRDDLEICHNSRIFYGPVLIVGIRPFTIPQQAELEQVYQWLKKERKIV